MSFVSFHNQHFLRFVQDSYYGWPWLSGAVVVFLLALLPPHRVTSRPLIVMTFLWCVLLLVGYGSLDEAPVLTCITTGFATWSVLRSLMWRARSPAGDEEKSRRGVRLPGHWLDAVIRDYFRVDPRGVYWLDLARATRGLKPQRSREQRRLHLISSTELPEWRRGLWLRMILPVVDLRTAIWCRLPQYWHVPDTRLALLEPQVSAVLDAEISRAARLMNENEAGLSFSEYRHRTLDPRARDQARSRAAHFGRSWTLLREARIETKLFRDEREERVPTLAEMSVEYHENWRFRRSFDWLWEESLEREAAARVRASTPALLSQNQWEEAAPSGSDVAAATTDTDEDEDELLQFVPLESDGEPDTETAWSGDDFDLSSEADDDSKGLENESQADKSEDDGAQDETRDDVVDETIDDGLIATDPDASSDPESEDAVDDEPAEKGSFFSRIRAVPASPEPQTLSDEEAFDLVDDELMEELSGRETGLKLSAAESERLRDLQRQCELLEAFLGIEPSGDFHVDAAQAERQLLRPANWTTATRLVLLYCLRADYRGPGVEHAKHEAIRRLRVWQRGLSDGDALAKETRRLFFELYIDWFAIQDAWSQIRELFAQRAPRTPYQFELLGTAEAHLAWQLRDRPSLRESLIRDATSAFFRAGISGFWTQRYAGLLLGTQQADETIRILCEHPVEFGRAEFDRLMDQVPDSQRQAPSEHVPEAPLPVLDVDTIERPPAKRRLKKAAAKTTAPGKRLKPVGKPEASAGEPGKPTRLRKTSDPGGPAPVEEAPSKPRRGLFDLMNQQDDSSDDSQVSGNERRKKASGSGSRKKRLVPARPGKRVLRKRDRADDSDHSDESKGKRQAKSTGKLTLVQVKDGKKYQFSYPVTAGADSNCTLRHKSLNDMHFRIKRNQDVAVLVPGRDKPDIKVNDQPVREAVVLRPGDVISIIGLAFEVKAV